MPYVEIVELEQQHGSISWIVFTSKWISIIYVINPFTYGNRTRVSSNKRILIIDNDISH
jgi:hypothetical protein